jgi:hypothetical protein
MCNALPRLKAFCSFPPLVMSLNEPNRSLNLPRQP